MVKIYSKENRILLAELVRTDFKLRYQGSLLGYAWSLLRPLLLFLILYIVFVKFLKIGNSIPHYPVYLLFGMVLWNFFSEMTMQSVGSIVGRGDLIRKISIPRWIIVISTSFSALINLFLNLIVVGIFMLVSNVPLHLSIIWLPLILIEVYFFSLGISFFLSAAFVKFRDIGYIWEVSMQGLFYLTPILYPLSRITNVTFQKIIMLNPMAQAMQQARYVAITKVAVTDSQLFHGDIYGYIPYVILVIVFLFGIWFFNRGSSHFAEEV